MNKQNIIATLIALVAFAACRPSAQKAAADAVESMDSTETIYLLLSNEPVKGSEVSPVPQMERIWTV